MEGLSYHLEDFEGPLDLLLAMIAKNKLNICDINIFDLIEQYIDYINELKRMDMDIASEFIEMAARLVYIKSSMLLPKHEESEQLQQQLTGELLEYQMCKEMAQRLSQMTTGWGRFSRPEMPAVIDKTYRRRHAPQELVQAYISAVSRGERYRPVSADAFKPLVERRVVSVASRVIHVLRRLRTGVSVRYRALFEHSGNRSELVATFLAVLELIKARRIRVSGEKDNMTVDLIREGVEHE